MDRRTLCLASVVVWPLAGIAVAGDLTQEEAFRRTSRLYGSVYVAARQTVEGQGRQIVPFLKGKASSKDWRERDLAKALLLRIQQPQRVAAWRRVLSARTVDVVRQNDGTAQLKFERREGGRVVDRGTVVFPPEAAYVVLDLLRERREGFSVSCTYRHAMAVLGALAIPETAQALLHLCGTAAHDKALADAFVGIGAPAVPLLRSVIENCPTEWPTESSDRAGATRVANSQGVHQSIMAARALTRLRDAKGAGLAAEKLKTAAHGDQVAALCGLVAELQVAGAAPTLFSHLVRAAGIRRRRRGSGSSWAPEYPDLRESMLSLSRADGSFLRDPARKGEPAPAPAIVTGLLFEIDKGQAAAAFYTAYGPAALAGERWRGPKQANLDPETKGRRAFWKPWRYDQELIDATIPRPLLLERASVCQHPSDLAKVSRLVGDALAVDVVADGLRASSQLALSLASMGDDRALAAYAKLLDRPEHSSWEPTVVETLLLLNSPGGVPLLEKIARDGPAADLAQLALPVLRGDRGQLLRLLAHSRSSVRAVAARVMARQGDLRAAPALIALAATARSTQYVTLRDALVSLGKPALPMLRTHSQKAASWRERLVCEDAALRIANPALADVFRKASRLVPRGFLSRAGPHLADYRQGGQQLAKAAGLAALPLIEAALAFQIQPPYPGIACFALAQLKQDRSIDVIVASAPNLRASCRRRGTSVPAAALAAFGPKGADAAKLIPPPDPSKARYPSRSQRHRVATEALDVAKHAKSVVNIVEGLASPPPKRKRTYGRGMVKVEAGLPSWATWDRRMRAYLRLAKNHRDRRLLEAALDVIARDRRYLGPDALAVAADYKDPRVEALCMEFLSESSDKPFRAGLSGLIKQRPKDAVQVLCKCLRASPNAKLRQGAAQALGLVGAESRETGLQDSTRRDALAQDVVAVGVDTLIQALADRSDSVQGAAAEALLKTARIQRKKVGARVPAALAQWVSSGGMVWGLPDYLASSGHPDAGPALLAAYRRSGGKDGDLALLLGKLKMAKALPDISQALDRRVAEQDCRGRGIIQELDGLARLGPAGMAKVYDVLRNVPRLAARTAAARVLASHGERRAFPEIAALFEETLSAEARDRRLTTPGEPSGEQHCQRIKTLADALSSLDPQRAYPIVRTALLRTSNAEARRNLTWTIEGLDREHPNLKQVPVPLAKRWRALPP